MKLIFRKINQNDVYDLFEYGADDETVKYLSWGPLKTIEDAQNSINFLLKNEDVWACELDKKMIGTFSLHSQTDKTVEIGYVLNKKYWKKGIGTMGMNYLIKYSLNKYPNKKILVFHNIENISSKKLIEKFSFKPTGIKIMNNKKYFSYVYDSK